MRELINKWSGLSSANKCIEKKKKGRCHQYPKVRGRGRTAGSIITKMGVASMEKIQTSLLTVIQWHHCKNVLLRRACIPVLSTQNPTLLVMCRFTARLRIIIESEEENLAIGEIKMMNENLILQQERGK